MYSFHSKREIFIRYFFTWRKILLRKSIWNSTFLHMSLMREAIKTALESQSSLVVEIFCCSLKNKTIVTHSKWIDERMHFFAVSFFVDLLFSITINFFKNRVILQIMFAYISNFWSQKVVNKNLKFFRVSDTLTLPRGDSINYHAIHRSQMRMGLIP